MLGIVLSMMLCLWAKHYIQGGGEKVKPILDISLKEELENLQSSAICNYAGCGLSNDGWPW